MAPRCHPAGIGGAGAAAGGRRPRCKVTAMWSAPPFLADYRSMATHMPRLERILAVGRAFLAVSALTGDVEGMELSNPWFWVEWVGYTAPFGWVAIDSLRSFSSASRRARIGLCDAVVVHRYLLWASFGALQVAGSFALVAMYSSVAKEQLIAAWADALVGGLEIASLAVLWFVFFPPVAYRRWLGGVARASQSPIGS